MKTVLLAQVLHEANTFAVTPALMLIADQAEFGQALTNEPDLAQVCQALFVCGTPYATQAGAAPWARPDVTFWGGISLASPLTNTPLVSSCDGKNLYGWPCDEPLEKLRADFLDATTDPAQRSVVEALQRRYYDVAPYISTGIVQRQVAYRSTLKGVLKTPYPVFWNVSKSE